MTVNTQVYFPICSIVLTLVHGLYQLSNIYITDSICTLDEGADLTINTDEYLSLPIFVLSQIHF